MQARRGRPVIMAAATARGAARNIEAYRKAAHEAGFSAEAIDHAISQCWVAQSVVLAPTDKEAREVGLPYFQQMQTYRAAQSTAFEAMVAKAKSQPGSPVLCGSPASMMEDFTSLEKTGIGGVIVRFRSNPMAAALSERALRLFMKEIAPRIRESRLAPVVA